MKRLPYIVVLGVVLAACGSSGGTVASLTTSPSRTATSPPPPATSPGISITDVTNVPRTLAATCAGKQIHLSASNVQAQADGVHVTVTFTSRNGGNFSYTSFNSDGSSGGSGMGVLSPGVWPEVYPLAPGKASLRCEGVDAEGSPLEKGVGVLDPHHYWTPITNPSCRLASAEATGPGATAVDAVREWAATNGHPHDELTVLGYPRAASPTIGVTQDAKLVARVSVFRAGGSGSNVWHIAGGACATFQTPETVPR